MVIAIEGLGTPESAWQAWPGLATLDTFALYPLPARVVIVAPHPDDEVLGVGGTLALLNAVGVQVTVIAVSDGETSHPHSPTQVAGIRRAEQTLARLGLNRARSTAVRLVRGQHKRKIKIPEVWPWAHELEVCFLAVFALVPP